MSRHSGLGRRSGIKDAAGDPLDGLVNLFDIGIVLAVAFMIAGLGLTLKQSTLRLRQRAQTNRRTIPLPAPTKAPSASGVGQPVGTVYRLAGGQLVYVEKPR